MERLWGVLAAIDVKADLPMHDPRDGLLSLATLELDVKHLANALHGYDNMCAETTYHLTIILALKARVGPVTFRSMKEKIPEIPFDGCMLLEEIKLCHPVAKAFLSFWEEHGRHLIVTLSRGEARVPSPWRGSRAGRC